jgi:hypothetical protein
VEEIARAHRLWSSHPASQLETVVICIYSSETEGQVKAAIPAELQRCGRLRPFPAKHQVEW